MRQLGVSPVSDDVAVLLTSPALTHGAFGHLSEGPTKRPVIRR